MAFKHGDQVMKVRGSMIWKVTGRKWRDSQDARKYIYEVESFDGRMTNVFRADELVLVTEPDEEDTGKRCIWTECPWDGVIYTGQTYGVNEAGALHQVCRVTLMQTSLFAERMSS